MAFDNSISNFTDTKFRMGFSSKHYVKKHGRIQQGQIKIDCLFGIDRTQKVDYIEHTIYLIL